MKPDKLKISANKNEAYPVKKIKQISLKGYYLKDSNFFKTNVINNPLFFTIK